MLTEASAFESSPGHKDPGAIAPGFFIWQRCKLVCISGQMKNPGDGNSRPGDLGMPFIKDHYSNTLLVTRTATLNRMELLLINVLI